MIKNYEVLETIRMIDEDKFDVRTITMGISLLDCVDADMDRLNEKIYQKIYSKAEHLVAVGEQLEKEYGVTIVNKRISVTPIALVVPSKNEADFIRIAHTLDKVALDTGVNFIGGFSGLVQKGMTDADKALIKAIPQALASTQRVCASLNVGSTKAGINMNAVRMVGDMLLECAHLTKDTNSNGCTKFVVFTNAVDDNPFMAGAYHGVGEPDCVVSVGVSGPGVVKRALREVHHQSFETLCDAIKKSAFKITRIGQLIGLEAARRLGVDFGIIDLSLAPTPAVGDSIAEIFNEMGLEYAGAPGTTAALALLNDSVKKGGLMASSHVGGLSGAFIPVSEDQGMIEAVQAGYLSLEKLEAMTCVCSVGLDMVAVPGSTSADTLAGLIADEMAIGMINQKTTAVRIIPVIGKEVGDVVEFGGLLGTAPIMHINSANCSAFVNRGGFIPAPLHSFKN